MNIQEIFRKGCSFMEFVNKDKDTYKENTLEIYHNIVINNPLERKIKGVHGKIHVLVFAEIWCPDCMINVSALQKIADINQNFRISIASREGNEAYLVDYKVGGKPKVPTFIFMDEDFNVLGAFIEQPQVLKDIETRGKQVEIIVAKRKYRKGEYIEETMKEILNIVKK